MHNFSKPITITEPEPLPGNGPTQLIRACGLSGRDLRQGGVDMGLPDDQLVGVRFGEQLTLEVEGHLISLHEEQAGNVKRLLTEKYSFSAAHYG